MRDIIRLQQRLAPALLLVLLGVFVVFAVVRPLVRPYAWSDFATFYSAAEAFRDGVSPYRLETLQATGHDDFAGWIGRYLYPPPFAATLVRPLTLLPFEVARRVWVILETVAYLAALTLLAGVVFGRRDRATLLATALVGLTWAPFRLDLRLGSVSGLLLLLLVLFLQALQRGHERRAGVFLGAATLLKVSPALVVLLFLLRGRWRLVFAALLSGLTLTAVSLPATGLQAWSDYMTQVVPLLGSANFSWFTNQSLDALFWRLFRINPDTTPWIDSVWLYRIGSIGTSLVVLATAAVLARRKEHATAAHAVWLGALGLVAALLVARVTWEYMTVLAIPCFLLWMSTLPGSSRAQWALFVLAWFLCAFPLPYTHAPLREGPGILLESPRLLGLCVAFAVCVGRTTHSVRGDSA